MKEACPLCKGSGKFEPPRSIRLNGMKIKKYIVNHLIEQGYGIRQIQRALGYKSPRSISVLIDKTKIKYESREHL